MKKPEFMRGVGGICGVVLLGLSLAGPAHALDVVAYENNYETPATVFSGITASAVSNGVLANATVGPFLGTGGKSWSGKVFINDTTGNPAGESSLTLGNLPIHTGVKIDFMLGLLDSWDSDGSGGFGPDHLDLYINGALVHQYTTNTALGNLKDYGGATLVASGVQAEDHSGYYSDVLLDMGTESLLTFADSASSLSIKLQASGAGWQGGGDESWGVDAFKVTLTGVTLAAPVPEASNWAMLLAGMGLLGAIALRRKATASGAKA